eukprot:TRINITY_DN257_c0_g1_i1.p7 TRINITY_DN257_c0_g1~~TRINITY_DN257_c0_g1_i1.p7  ORF type:complete len:105 (-),score=8.73 TRINITY_DN257_c0_g1_i1:37-351(-)
MDQIQKHTNSIFLMPSLYIQTPQQYVAVALANTSASATAIAVYRSSSMSSTSPRPSTLDSEYASAKITSRAVVAASAQAKAMDKGAPKGTKTPATAYACAAAIA